MVAQTKTIKNDIVKINIMWGFGLYLMRLADYLAGRSYQNEKRTTEADRLLTTTKECHICGEDFLDDTLDEHIKEKHSDML